MAGIEPAAATLARRARYLSCHPQGRRGGRPRRRSGRHGGPAGGAHAMDESICDHIPPRRVVIRRDGETRTPDKQFWRLLFCR